MTVFLSYNRADALAVQQLDSWLAAQGIRCFLDIRELRAGQPWLPELDRFISRESTSVVVFVGPAGIGNTQHYECALANQRQRVEPDFPLIPVLLPGTPEWRYPRGLLGEQTWVDFSGGLADPHAQSRLLAAIRRDALDSEEVRGAICPYKGLAAFQEEDARAFFGRDQEAAELHRTVVQHGVAAVIGRSGSGKSSLARAGLLPRLRRKQNDQWGTVWDRLVLRPGRKPLRALAEALSPRVAGEDEVAYFAAAERTAEALRLQKPDFVAEMLHRRLAGLDRQTDRFLILLDQAEEMFARPIELTDTRAIRDWQAESEQLLALLVGAAQQGAASLVLTIRSDYFDPLQHSPMGGMLKDSMVATRGVQDLRAAIAGPATLVGLRFSPGLEDRILRETGDDESNLPLLQHALEQSWQAREGAVITSAAYDRSGGVEKAISLAAQATFDALTLERQAAAKRLFLRLVRPGEGRGHVRLRAPLPDDANERAVAERFAEPKRRLLFFGQAQDGRAVVEVAHEALIRGWPLLLDWVAENRERLATRDAVLDWQANSKGELLPDGALLARGRALLDDAGDVAIETVAPLIRASEEAVARGQAAREALAAHQAELERDLVAERATAAERLLRRTRLAALVAGIFALVAAGAGGVAWQQRDAALRAARDADMARTASQRAAESEAMQRHRAEEAARNATAAAVAAEQARIEAQAAARGEAEQRQRAEEATRSAQAAAAAAEQARGQALRAAGSEAEQRRRAEEATRTAQASAGAAEQARIQAQRAAESEAAQRRAAEQSARIAAAAAAAAEQARIDAQGAARREADQRQRAEAAAVAARQAQAAEAAARASAEAEARNARMAAELAEARRVAAFDFAGGLVRNSTKRLQQDTGVRAATTLDIVDRAIEALTALEASAPTEDVRQLRTEALFQRAGLLAGALRLEEAATVAQQAVAAAEEGVRRAPSAEWLRLRAMGHGLTADAAFTRGNHREAWAATEAEAAALSAAAERDPRRQDLARAVVSSRLALAGIAGERGDLDLADRLLRDSTAALATIGATHGPSAEHRALQREVTQTALSLAAARGHFASVDRLSSQLAQELGRAAEEGDGGASLIRQGFRAVMPNGIMSAVRPSAEEMASSTTAIQHVRIVLQLDPADRARRLTLATLETTQATSLMGGRDFAAARRATDTAIASLRGLATEVPVHEVQEALAEALSVNVEVLVAEDPRLHAAAALRHVDEALRIRRRAIDAQPSDPIRAETWMRTALLRTDVLAQTGAEAQALEALTGMRAYVNSWLSSRPRHHRFAEIGIDLEQKVAGLSWALARPADAQAAIRAALAHLDRLGPLGQEPKWLANRAAILRESAWDLFRRVSPADGLAAMHAALQTGRQLAAHPEVPARMLEGLPLLRAQHADMMSEMPDIQTRRAATAEARAAMADLLAMESSRSDVTAFRADVVLAQYYLSEVLAGAGDQAGAARERRVLEARLNELRPALSTDAFAALQRRVRPVRYRPAAPR